MYGEWEYLIDAGWSSEWWACHQRHGWHRGTSNGSQETMDSRSNIMRAYMHHVPCHNASHTNNMMSTQLNESCLLDPRYTRKTPNTRGSYYEIYLPLEFRLPIPYNSLCFVGLNLVVRLHPPSSELDMLPGRTWSLIWHMSILMRGKSWFRFVELRNATGVFEGSVLKRTLPMSIYIRIPTWFLGGSSWYHYGAVWEYWVSKNKNKNKHQNPSSGQISKFPSKNLSMIPQIEKCGQTGWTVVRCLASRWALAHSHCPFGIWEFILFYIYPYITAYPIDRTEFQHDKGNTQMPPPWKSITCWPGFT